VAKEAEKAKLTAKTAQLQARETMRKSEALE
jgi:hypothetical protein